VSDIPLHLHPKVRNQVNYLNFVSKEGVFDDAAFTAAVRKELSDGWPSAKVIGGGAMVRDVVDNTARIQEKEDDETVEKMVAAVESRKLKKV